jgi:hypothetical protein
VVGLIIAIAEPIVKRISWGSEGGNNFLVTVVAGYNSSG